MGLGDTYGWYQYKGDNGLLYAIRMSAAIATATGAVACTSPFVDDTTVIWPLKRKDLRYVLANDGAGHEDKFVIGDATATLWISGGTVVLGARTYTIRGWIGEKFTQTGR